MSGLAQILLSHCVCVLCVFYDKEIILKQWMSPLDWQVILVAFSGVLEGHKLINENINTVLNQPKCVSYNEPTISLVQILPLSSCCAR